MKRRSSSTACAGYSLAEVLVSVFIITVVVGILGAAFVGLYRSYLLYSTKNELLIDAGRMIDQIGNSVRPAYSIEASHVIDSTTYTSDRTTVVLKIASLDPNGDPLAGVFDYVVFTRDGMNTALLREIIDADPSSARIDRERVLGENVDDLVFLYKDANPVESTELYASITVAKNAGSIRPSFTLHIDAKLRNK